MWAFLISHYQRIAARKMFSRWSPLYETEVEENSYSAADHVAQASIKHLFQAGISNPTLIDAGIGTGLLAQQVFDSLPCRITGLDFTDDMMAICAAREITELLIKCDVGKDPWPLPPASFDMVVSAGLFEYLTPPMMDHFLKQSHITLKNGGTLIFTYLPRNENEQGLQFWRGHSGTYLTCGYTPAAIEHRLKENHFEVMEHTIPFKGCVFYDGSSYDYRLIVARKI